MLMTTLSADEDGAESQHVVLRCNEQARLITHITRLTQHMQYLGAVKVETELVQREG